MKLRRRERLAILAALAYLACCGCTSSSKSAVELDTAATLDLAATESQRIESEVRTGPETITTTVEEYGGGGDPGVRIVDSPAQRGIPATTSSVARAVPTTGQLIRRTVTVDQRAPAVAETHAEAQQATQEHATAATETQATSEAHRAPAVGCMLGLGFWGAVLMAALAAAALLVLRLRGRLP